MIFSIESNQLNFQLKLKLLYIIISIYIEKASCCCATDRFFTASVILREKIEGLLPHRNCNTPFCLLKKIRDCHTPHLRPTTRDCFF